MSTIVQSQLFRNDTNLDAIDAFEVPLKMPPPNAVESSPCGRVVAVSTQVGITFYWSSQTNSCRDVGVSRSLHTVELPECVSCMTFSSVSMQNMARLYLATNNRVFAWAVIHVIYALVRDNTCLWSGCLTHEQAKKNPTVSKTTKPRKDSSISVKDAPKSFW